MVAPWSNNASWWLNLERRISAGLWLNCSELKLEWILLLVESKVLDDVKIKVVTIRSTSGLRTFIVLVEYLPVDLNTFDAGIFNVESFADRLTLGNDSRDRQSGWDSVIVQANLIWWNTDWTTTDRNAHREFNIR